MTHRTTAFVMAVVALSVVWMATATAFELALEAELATEIKEPMVIGVPEDPKDHGGAATPDPSNGEYVWAPGAPATGDPIDHQGYCRFVVQIPADDTYYLWGWVLAWDGNSDSFWVTVWQDGNDDADQDKNPQASQDTNFRWGVAQGPAWHWDRINHWLDGGTFDRQWDLIEGEATITIWTREAATMLDALWITDDGGAAQGKLPTDEDRERQVNDPARAVQATGKLAAVWAKLKTR